MSCNENFWVEQLTVPHPPPWGRTRVGKNMGAGTPFGKEGLQPTSQRLAIRVYHMPTMSAVSRPCIHMADYVYKLFGAFSCARVNAFSVCPPSLYLPLRTPPRAPSYPFPRAPRVPSQYLSSVCPRSPQHAPSSLAPLARDPYPFPFLAHSREVYTCTNKRRQQSVLGGKALPPCSQVLALRIYNVPTVSTVSRPHLHVADCICRLQPAFICAQAKAVG